MNKLKQYWKQIVLGIGCIFIICFVLEIRNNIQLKRELKEIRTENVIMQTKVDSLENENVMKLAKIDSLNMEIDTLKVDLNSLKKRKNKVIERVKYIQPVNDTIKNFIELERLNQAIIRDFERIVEVKDSIITEYQFIIDNDLRIKEKLDQSLKQKDEQIKAYNRDLKKAKNQKVFFGSTTSIAVGLIIILILL